MTEGNLKRTILNSFVWKFGEQLLVQIISFSISIIVARILLPDDYGIVAIVSVFISILSVLINNGLPTSLIQKRDSDELDFNSIFYCNFLLSLVLYLILNLAAGKLALLYSQPKLTAMFRIMGLSLPILSINSIQRAYISKHMQFKKLFFSTLFGTIVSGIVGIYAALNGFGSWALIIQNLLNLIMDTTILFFSVPWMPKKKFSMEAAKPLIKYGWKNMAADGFGTICNQFSSLIIGMKYTAEDLAFFSKGKSIPELIDNNVFTALATVLFPAMSKSTDDLNSLKEMTRRSMQISTFILFPLLFGIIGVSKSLVIVLLTEKWAPCIPYICASSIVGVFSIMPTINQQVIKGLGRSDLALKLEFIKKPVFLFCILFSSYISVFWVAASIVLAAIWDSIINGIVVYRLINYSMKEQILDIFPQLTISIIMLVCILSINLIKLPSLVLMIIQILVGILIYFFISLVFKVKPLNYTLTLIKKRGKIL